MKRKFCLLYIILFLCTSGLLAQDVKQAKSDPNVPLFEVKNDLGQTVFAVYPGGVHIFIDDTPAKGAGGGFSIGRMSTGKATADDYFTVNPGDVRVIIPPTTAKAAGAGFSVGRLSTGKAAGDVDFLKVTPDSTRVYTSSTSSKGFAVGKYAAGDVDVDNFLNLTQENYFIGHDVAPNITTGTKNNVFGYTAGNSLTTGYNNVFIGDSAGHSNGSGHDNIFVGNRAGWKATGNENIFIGTEAGYNSLGPVRNLFIGYLAGRANLIGQYNVYLGDQAGTNGLGYYNTIIGGQAASTNNFGNSNVAVGYVAGRDMVSTRNVYLGQGAGYNNAGTVGGNVFIGYYAGEDLSDQDNRLSIDNRTTGFPLIYGEFDNHRVAINTTNPNGYTFYVNGTSSGTSDWATPSDMRLKTNILTIPSALEKVLQLRGVSYSWKDPETFDNKKHIGFLAQEVEKVVPEVVVNNNDSYSMQYAPITALLVEAMKEQQEQINKLTEENRFLKEQVSDIKKLKEDIEFLKKQFEEEKKKN